MPSKKVEQQLFNVLLTQKSINGEMPYDAIERVVQESIEYVKRENINAQIANIALNINGKLVIAQIYVERQNGFAATKENKFGTTPTAYNVQVRFPFDLELTIGQDAVILPGGDFHHTLVPYTNSRKSVSDDVQRDFKPEDIVLGAGVGINIDKANKKVSLKCMPDGEQVTFTSSDEKVGFIGRGYATHMLPDGLGGWVETEEYFEQDDYHQRLKMGGVYPLFYSSKTNPHQGVLRRHSEYRGYTKAQNGAHEPNDHGKQARVDQYHAFLNQVDQEIRSTPAGQAWAASKATSSYVFDITVINGITLFSDSGLPVIRLRDYQLELFNRCLHFIESVNQRNTEGTLQPGLAGKINMGVGAGKTFFTFTLLKHLKYTMESDPGALAPPYCMAPDEAVAQVTEKSINRQGVTTGTSAASITKKAQMPTQELMRFYMRLTERAARDAQHIHQFIQNDLQADILKFTKQHRIHPNKILNFLGVYQNEELKTRVSTFKDSIDMKRLLLLVDGQKTIMSKTGMRGISALYNLLEQFTSIQEGIQKEAANPLFQDARLLNLRRLPLVIDYNQNVRLSAALETAMPNGQLNVTTMTEANLRTILFTKHTAPARIGGAVNYRAIRDILIKMACVTDNDAAILLANSGGLGNTYTNTQLQQQIEQFLPIAYAQFSSLAKQAQYTAHDHYQMYLYLNELFSSIPEEINFKVQVNCSGVNLDEFNQALYVESLNENIQLIDELREKINTQIAQLETVGSDDAALIEQYGIKPSATVIEAADQLAGIASLSITGHATDDNAKLLLTHLPVFTPEGLASYFEHLKSLENQPVISFHEQHGVYAAQTRRGTRVSIQDIKERLQQVLRAVMIADEAHKDEFKFLFDENNPFYKRISAVTQHYLNKPFIDVLPHRIGMSGTINQVADHAFGETTLYSLSTQQMIQQGLMKQVSVDTRVLPPLLDWKSGYAKQIVIDYFIQNSNVSIKNTLQRLSYGIDLFALSKGIIFSKEADPELNDYIINYFNLLVREDLAGDDVVIQKELFNRINQDRISNAGMLRAKLKGEVELTVAEIEQVNRSNLGSRRPLIIQDNKIINLREGEVPLEVRELNPRSLQELHRTAFQNNLFAIYLEYILSKSSAPKELSDIIGMQNALFEKGRQLIHFPQLREENECQSMLSLMQGVDPKSITKADIRRFIVERIKDYALQVQLIESILKHKNDPLAFAEALVQETRAIRLGALITADRNVFESGKALAMLGSRRERTGYSHEPLGIVIDVPSDFNLQMQINDYVNLFIKKRREAINMPDDVQRLQRLAKNTLNMPDFLQSLQRLAKNTLSYDEKNQAGGRALRTPYGHARYIQYQTTINDLVLKGEPAARQALLALKLETQFQDIFTSDEKLAQEERASITFNREVLSILERDMADISTFYAAIRMHFARELSDSNTQRQYKGYIHYRLPLLWSMKYKPAIAAAYMAEPNDVIFEALRSSVQVVNLIKPKLKKVSPKTQADKVQVVIDREPIAATEPVAKQLKVRGPNNPSRKVTFKSTDDIYSIPATHRHKRSFNFKALLLTLGTLVGAGLGVGLVITGLFAPLGAGIVATVITAGVCAIIGLGLTYGMSKLVNRYKRIGSALPNEPIQTDNAPDSYGASMAQLKRLDVKADKKANHNPEAGTSALYPLFTQSNTTLPTKELTTEPYAPR